MLQQLRNCKVTVNSRTQHAPGCACEHSITIPLREDDPAAEERAGLVGSPTDSVTVLESLHSLKVDSPEDPSHVVAPSPD
jgi:hypothetical protein